MGIFIDGTEHSLRNALNLVDQYSKYSGLTPNLEIKVPSGTVVVTHSD